MLVGLPGVSFEKARQSTNPAMSIECFLTQSNMISLLLYVLPYPFLLGDRAQCCPPLMRLFLENRKCGRIRGVTAGEGLIEYNNDRI